MSHSKKTENYELPIVEPMDKPTWSAEFNALSRGVDAAIHSVADSTAGFNLSLKNAIDESVAAREAADSAMGAAQNLVDQVDLAAARAERSEQLATTAGQTASEAARNAGAAVTDAKRARELAEAANSRRVDTPDSGITEFVTTASGPIWGQKTDSMRRYVVYGTQYRSVNDSGDARVQHNYGFKAIEFVMAVNGDATRAGYIVRAPHFHMDGDSFDVRAYWGNGTNLTSGAEQINIQFMMVGYK